MIYAFKIAGARAEEMASLPEVKAVAQKAADACRSIGMALSPCTVPQVGKPTFMLGEDEMEMGMGIHGEPGIWRATIKPADAVTDEMMDRLLACHLALVCNHDRLQLGHERLPLRGILRHLGLHDLAELRAFRHRFLLRARVDHSRGQE